MAKVQVGARIDAKVKKVVEAVCESRGLKMNRFIEDAILDKLEELQDVEDILPIRREPTKPFRKLLAELALDDKI